MESLEVTMNKHYIHLNTCLISSSRHALSTSRYAHNASSFCSYYSNEWLIYFGSSNHMEKDKTMFLPLNDCKTKLIFVDNDRSLSVLGSGIVHQDNS